MKGKYQNHLSFFLAKAYKIWLRYRIKNIVSWSRGARLDPGCTAVIGMCSQLPGILAANLTCLSKSRWSDLKEVLIVVDGKQGVLAEGFEKTILNKFSELNITFLYYDERQANLTEKIKLPYIYSWLSWCIAFSQVKTQTVLIHDYDALVLGNFFEERYLEFQKSGAKIQGIAWYNRNGIVVSDRLATTFEAFVDVAWIKSFSPIQLFNKVEKYKDKTVDYDSLLDIQANHTPESQRTIMPMDLNKLVHPSQMIHQYTMFCKFPGKTLPCFSIIMIPFFNFLSGDESALEKATQAILQGKRESMDLFGNRVKINLSELTTPQVDWMLKQSIQVFIALKISPFKALIDYGTALYQIAKTPSEKRWLGDFLPEQRQWINGAKSL
jgi:hypothetical protein